MIIDNVLSTEKFLLQKKDHLYLEKTVKEDELEELNRKIQNIELEKEYYKKYKSRILDRYIINIIQIIATGAAVDVPTHILANNYDVITGDYIISGSVLFLLGILTVDFVSELKNYKKNNNLNLKDLEHRRTELINSLQDNKQDIHKTILELDEVYDSLVTNETKTKIKI